MSRSTCGIIDSMNLSHFRYSKKTRLIHSILCSCFIYYYYYYYYVVNECIELYKYVKLFEKKRR